MPIAILHPVYRMAVLALALLPAMASDAQILRVSSGNSSSGMNGQSGYTEVYQYDVVDYQPHFPGGDCALLKFINSERRYPSEAYSKRIEGRVLCSFVVNPDGSISHVSVMRGVEESLDREAVRIINNMPRWEAGRVGQQPVPVYCVLPIPFRL